MKDESASFILHPSSFILELQLFLEFLCTLIADLIIREIDVGGDLGQTPDASVLARSLREVTRDRVVHSVISLVLGFQFIPSEVEGSAEAQQVSPRRGEIQPIRILLLNQCDFLRARPSLDLRLS